MNVRILFALALGMFLTSPAFGQTDTLTLVGVGDIMMGSNHGQGILPPQHGAGLMAEVSSLLRSADVTFGNLEGVLLDEGGTPKQCRNPKVCYTFRTPVSYVRHLQEAGFDVMSIANNHAGDFGDVGRKSTMHTLTEAGIEFAGQLQKPFVVFERKGIKFGFVAFAPNSNCVSLNDIPGAVRLVQKVDSLADVVIVSFHGGAEGPAYQHVPRTDEMFYGENRGNVHAFSHAVIDAGADIVLGHGPHHTRGVELYKDRFIAYSLGNFCTYGMNIEGVNGLAPIVKVYFKADGSFLQAHITSTDQQLRTQVSQDPQNKVLHIIQKLSKEDFPESTLLIDDAGWVRNSTK